jgi:hypothetical protein
MADTIYYYPLPSLDEENYSILDSHPHFNQMYDLEPVDPPHRRFKCVMDKCPAISIHRNHTYFLRSPFDYDLTYDYDSKKWTSKYEQEFSPIITPIDDQPYIQLKVLYLFWSEKKTNTQLWQHDAPLYTLDKLPTWDLVSGMIPIGSYTRNLSVGIALKDLRTHLIISRGDPLYSVTLVGDSAINLVKKKPSEKVFLQNIENYSKKEFCPYTFTKKLFQRWFK